MENKENLIKNDLFIFREKQDMIIANINKIIEFLEEYKKFEDDARKKQNYSPVDVMHLAQADSEFEKEHQLFIDNHKKINTLYDTFRKI